MHVCTNNRHTPSIFLMFAPAPKRSGDVARQYMKDPQLLGLIDLECFVFSTVPAAFTPMINAGLVSGLV